VSRPLTILGMNTDAEVVFTFHPDEPGKELTLGEADLCELMNAITRDYLPLWPTAPCRDCGADSVVTIEGSTFCDPHAGSWMMREAEAGRWGK